MTAFSAARCFQSGMRNLLSRSLVVHTLAFVGAPDCALVISSQVSHNAMMTSELSLPSAYPRYGTCVSPFADHETFAACMRPNVQEMLAALT